jgi:hypothetical protein
VAQSEILPCASDACVGDGGGVVFAKKRVRTAAPEISRGLTGARDFYQLVMTGATVRCHAVAAGGPGVPKGYARHA